MADSYKTIDKLAEGIYKEKGSKFLAFAFPVYDENEVRECLAKLKKDHPKARHHCYAYKIGIEGKLFKANDDHEPTYTAGKPILNQIESKGLTNVLIIVVRYFGGSLLGISGLTKAYKAAAGDAIENGVIVEKTLMNYYELKFDYAVMNEVMSFLKKEKVEMIEKKFRTDCTLLIASAQNIEKMLNSLQKNNTFSFEFLFER